MAGPFSRKVETRTFKVWGKEREKMTRLLLARLRAAWAMPGHRSWRQHRPQAQLAPPACTADRQAVAAALSALPDPYRSVIVETFYRRRSVPDTADLLGVSADMVKAHCYDALWALKDELAERGIAACATRLPR